MLLVRNAHIYLTRPICLLVLAQIIITIAFLALGPYLLIYLSHYSNISVIEVSSAIMIALILGHIFSFVISSRISSHNAGMTAQIGALCLALGIGLLILTGYLPEHFKYSIIVISQIIFRIAHGVITNAIYELINQAANKTRKLSIVLGIIDTGGAIGAMIGAGIGFYILTKYSFVTLLLFIIAMDIALFIVYLLLSDGRLKAAAITDKVKVSFGEMITALNPGEMMIYISIAGIFVCFLDGQLTSFIPLKNQAIYIDHAKITSGFFIAQNLTCLLATIPVIRLTDFMIFSNLTKLIASVVVMVVGIILFTIDSGSFAIVLVASIIIAVGGIIFDTYSIVLIKQIAAKKQKFNIFIAQYNLATIGIGKGTGQYIGTIVFVTSIWQLSVMIWIVIGLGAILALLSLKSFSK